MLFTCTDAGGDAPCRLWKQQDTERISDSSWWEGTRGKPGCLVVTGLPPVSVSSIASWSPHDGYITGTACFQVRCISSRLMHIGTIPSYTTAGVFHELVIRAH
jgi:hypothetical protein